MRLAIASLIAFVVLCSSAVAKNRTHPAGNGCVTLTVINQANVRGGALAQVEAAVGLQMDYQVAPAWSTPCVSWGASGWNIYLQTGYKALPGGGSVDQIGGAHFGVGVPGPYWAGQPYAIVDTGQASYESWSYAFDHEVIEMLEDPGANSYFTFPNGTEALREICDPVNNYTYSQMGVNLADFTLPSAWSGGAYPYDELGRLPTPLAWGATLGIGVS